jgi:hypothetical protein
MGGTVKRTWRQMRGSAFVVVPVDRLKALQDNPSIAAASAIGGGSAIWGA